MTPKRPNTVADLLNSIDAGWDKFCGYINTLSEAQLTKPTDAEGWTAKDHLIHIATWEDTLNALLEKSPMWERINIDKALWYGNDVDAINAAVQKRCQHMPLVEVRQKHQEVHQQLLPKIRTLSDGDLHRPVREYQPDSSSARHIITPLIADTYDAYKEHTPWIAAIVAKA